MNEEDLPRCPKWVADEALIHQLLSSFLDKIERGVKPQIRLNSKTAPQLYDFNTGDTQYLWRLIQKLDKSYQLISIKPQRAKTGKEVYEDALIHFDTSHENILRHWLKRPEHSPYLIEWNTAVSTYSDVFEQSVGLLQDNPIHHRDKSATEIVHAISLIKEQLNKPVTLRVLAARCFWGDSKFLDKREDFLKALFPAVSANIVTRPLLINIFVPDNFTSVLFIENQDTFLMLADLINNNKLPATSPLCGMALVYSAGFRGSASRIRQPGNAIFSHLGLSSHQVVNQFEQWWFSETGSLPSHFWGDLDYSGLAILAALRKVFEDMEAWKPGYEAMIRHYYDGIHHSLEAAGKDNQKDPGSTGCQYADNCLLPLMRIKSQFLDQEIVDAQDLGSYSISAKT